MCSSDLTKLVRHTFEIGSRGIGFTDVAPDHDGIGVDISHFLKELVNVCVADKVQMQVGGPGNPHKFAPPVPCRLTSLCCSAIKPVLIHEPFHHPLRHKFRCVLLDEVTG